MKKLVIAFSLLLLSNCFLFDPTDIDLWKVYRVKKIKHDKDARCIISIEKLDPRFDSKKINYEEELDYHAGYDLWFYAPCKAYEIGDNLRLKMEIQK